jgi:hypothetical protein
MSEPSNTVRFNGLYDRVVVPFFYKGMSDYERLKSIMYTQGYKMMELDWGAIYQLDKYFVRFPENKLDAFMHSIKKLALEERNNNNEGENNGKL